LFFLASSCRKDSGPAPMENCKDPKNPKCSNYDPCLSQAQTSAIFRIDQLVTPQGSNGYFEYVEGHTKLAMGEIKFSALFSANEYRWYIGAEKLSDSSFSRSFSPPSALFDLPITVSLAVEKIVDTACFPNDIGYDSISRTFILQRKCDYLIDNTFRGYWENNPSDSFEVNIDYYHPNDSLSLECFKIRISNFDNSNFQNCKDWNLMSFGKTNNYLEIRKNLNLSNDCLDPIGWVKVEESGEVRMEYFLARDNDGDMNVDDYDTIPKIFIGHVK
jgi:hypothetical protein